VVLTTNALKDASSMLGPYVAFKRQVRPTILVTETKTYLSNGSTLNSGWANGVTLPSPVDYQTTDLRAEAIHTWLAANYKTLNIQDLLLIGDPDPVGGDVPMKNILDLKYWECDPDTSWDKVCGMCDSLPTPPPAGKGCGDATAWQCNKWKDPRDLARSTPSDYYYANLSSTWPKDADGDVSLTKITATNPNNGNPNCSYSASYNIGALDYAKQDLNIGRIPLRLSRSDRAANLDSILGKFIAYTSSKDIAWRKKALLAMDTQGGVEGSFVPYGEFIRSNVLVPNAFGSYRVYADYTVLDCQTYEQGHPGWNLAACIANLGLGEIRPTSYTNVGSAWAGSAWPGCSGAICSQPKMNFGVVTWAAHGSHHNSSNIIDVNGATQYAAYLDDAHPAFVASQSCENAHPDTDGMTPDDNVAAALLRKGAIGFLGATRTSWEGFFNHYDLTTLYASTGVGNVDVVYGFVKGLVDSKLTGGQAMKAMLINRGAALAGVSDLHTRRSMANQIYMFNYFGDPTIGLENPGSSTVIPLPPYTPTNVTLTANQTKTFYADNWPSKGNPNWTADIVLTINSLSGSPIPKGTVWVNGVSYSYGGNGLYYQVLNIADKGPYTIDISSSTSANLQLTLNNM
jgi:hypothetical protein